MALVTKPRKTAAPSTKLALVEPRPTVPHSERRPNVIAALEIGESTAEALRLDFDSTSKDDVEAAVDNLTSTMSKAAVRASQRTGNKYVTEVGRFFTRKGDIIVTAVVTRVE